MDIFWNCIIRSCAIIACVTVYLTFLSNITDPFDTVLFTVYKFLNVFSSVNNKSGQSCREFYKAIKDIK